MATKLCAIAVLALIVSPFTAPFRTLDLSPDNSPIAFDQADSAGQIGSLVTQSGRLKITPPMGVAVLVPSGAEPPLIAVVSRTSTAVPRLADDPNRFTVLRL